MPAPATFDVRAALLEAARAELSDGGRAAISLRAVARRAGVSHAAPKHHFGDRAGLLDALAIEGFTALSAAMRTVDETDPRRRLAALGDAYVDFGLANPALLELMFSPSGPRAPDDDALRAARTDAMAALITATDGTDPPGAPSSAPLALVSWALAHGLTVLARDGALQAAAGVAEADTAQAVHDLVALFSFRVLPPG